MNFQEFGLREVLMLARWGAIPIGAIIFLVGWMVWRSTRQRGLQKRVAALESQLGRR